ncbi:substrate-binding domain-containing protein [Priestia aryabhattai]|uniref:substrate-binding domain-containing protein n=1 Tax=Priestia aryabhattai TaxID=412384 RepID=UPI003D2BB6E3
MELEALEMLKYKQIDSLIVLSRILSLNQYEEYLSYGKIVMCEKVEHKGFQSIYIDQYSAFQCAFEFLVRKGHKNIGYSTGREMGYSSNQREKAYIEGLAAINQNLKKEWVFTNSFFLEDGKILLKNLLELNTLPTALIVTNDMVAAGIILESKKRPVEVPNNLSIIGFNNDSIAEAMGITTISLPLKNMGSQALEYSLKKDVVLPIKVSFSLLVRDTVQQMNLL